METDICKCGDDRKAHKDLMGEIAQAARPGASPSHIEIEGCLDFILDRKATWRAERGQRRPRMATLLTGCRVCGAPSVKYHRDATGRLLHTGCLGRKANTLNEKGHANIQDIIVFCGIVALLGLVAYWAKVDNACRARGGVTVKNVWDFPVCAARATR